MSTEVTPVEQEHISTAVAVEQIEANRFRSIPVFWAPVGSRGAFGGQMMAQAVVAATRSVDPGFSLHSFHTYFISSTVATIPVDYIVDSVRDGKSYVTRMVKAIQRDRMVMVILCSFHKSEPWQPTYHWSIPDVPAPEQCKDDQDYFDRGILGSNFSEKIYQAKLAASKRNPIQLRTAKLHYTDASGNIHYTYWLRTRNGLSYDGGFHKSILAYISDFKVSISIAPGIMGLKEKKIEGLEYLGMTSTLDHTVWFYSDNFDTGDWLLYELDCPRIGLGRCLVNGRLFTRDGKLVAVVAQEGILRANVRNPDDTAGQKSQSKL